MEGTVGILVADSGPFIKGAKLESWSSNIVTVKEVVREIRDTNTRQRLQVLPYELTFREPSQQSLHFANNGGLMIEYDNCLEWFHADCVCVSKKVLKSPDSWYCYDCTKALSEFSKKTGDYHSLSSVDMRVIALVHQMECEHGLLKGANINTEPSSKKISSCNSVQNEDPIDNVVSQGEEPVCNLDNHEQGVNQQYNSDGDNSYHDNQDTRDDFGTLDNNQQCDIDGEEVGTDNHSLDNQQYDVDGEEVGTDNHSLDNQQYDVDGEEEDGWITPTNIKTVTKKMGGGFEEEVSHVAVGCITTDFAIQNVLLQMGLNVISLDGLLIKRLQTYALRCKACFKIALKYTKNFCPFCGNRSLIKVRVEVNSDGTINHYSLSNRQFSHKGLRYSIPLPKGGRQSNLSLLAPNQRSTFRLPRSKEKINPLDPDYITRTSPFRSNDVNSRGAQIAFRHGQSGRVPQAGWKRNPNKVKKTKK